MECLKSIFGLCGCRVVKYTVMRKKGVCVIPFTVMCVLARLEHYTHSHQNCFTVTGWCLSFFLYCNIISQKFYHQCWFEVFLRYRRSGRMIYSYCNRLPSVMIHTSTTDRSLFSGKSTCPVIFQELSQQEPKKVFSYDHLKGTRPPALQMY